MHSLKKIKSHALIKILPVSKSIDELKICR